jgi:hypothetical protein
MRAMSELKKTMFLAGGAAALALLAFVTAPRPPAPDAFADRGEAFFPDFEDPNAAATLEVVEFDEEAGAARPFKVTNSGGRWTIPSHHDYPADGEDRLARTAAGVMGIHKDDFRSDNVADHEALGVVDPLDEGATSLKGRGQRVTLKDESGAVLADFVVGQQPEGRDGFRFVRIPGQKRVYAARMDVDLSTRFEDWIERDLLKLERGDIEKVVIKDYSINERTGRLDQRDVVTLTKDDDGDWKTDRMRSNQEVDSTKSNALLGALDDLNIVGVRPKPAGLSASLTRTEGARLTQADVQSLQSRGYYFTYDGQLVSNEGEVQVESTEGVRYTLRFGEVVYGTGEALTAGTAGTAASGPGEEGEKGDEDRGPGENRYLFITADFDPRTLPEPRKPSDTSFLQKAESEWTDADRDQKELFDAHEEWKTEVGEGREKAEELNRRFARWYYVIPADDFEKLRVSRKDLLKAKSS